jgi:hypothetical protein
VTTLFDLQPQIDLARLTELMIEAGCRRLYVKELAPNDNSKNQPYFGSNFETLNIIPNRGIYADSTDRRPIFKAGLDFYWLDDEGRLWEAPNAKLILYPQYPEVRFSGFLLGCKNAPSELWQPRKDGVSQLPERLLFLGIRDDGKIVGYVVPFDTPLAREFFTAGDFQRVGVFRDASPLLLKTEDTRSAVLAALFRIHQEGWIGAKLLQKDGSTVACRGSNCGGYTLEAELGILPNGYSEPDYLGWEVKQHAVSSFNNLLKTMQAGAITLLTPEPTAGFYRERGVIDFVFKFGYKDKRGREDRYNFGGVHKAGSRQSSTNLTLTLDGYDAEAGKITDASGGLTLYSPSGERAATWLFADLMTHWNRKHAQAVYVPAISQRVGELNEYRYGELVRMGEGTDFLRFLKCVAEGTVYYDPGIKVENVSTRPRSKRRNQFRIKSGEIGALYSKLTVVSLT